MKYESMSDFEINRAVAEIEYPNLSVDTTPSVNVFGKPCGKGSTVTIYKSIGRSRFMLEFVDYCNNPNDAVPLIIENGISLEFNSENVFQRAWKSNEDGYPEFEHGFEYGEHRDPMVASMIVYLMIKESNND